MSARRATSMGLAVAAIASLGWGCSGARLGLAELELGRDIRSELLNTSTGVPHRVLHSIGLEVQPLREEVVPDVYPCGPCGLGAMSGFAVDTEVSWIRPPGQGRGQPQRIGTGSIAAGSLSGCEGWGLKVVVFEWGRSETTLGWRNRFESDKGSKSIPVPRHLLEQLNEVRIRRTTPCDRDNGVDPVYVDELSEADLDALRESATFFSRAVPSAVRASVERLRESVESAWPGKWRWSALRQAASSGAAPGLADGAFVLRGRVGRAGIAIAVEPVLGDIQHVVLWNRCAENMPLFP